jgi:hypothetical protein
VPIHSPIRPPLLTPRNNPQSAEVQQSS